jgi:signal transduction histidine kinase
MITTLLDIAKADEGRLIPSRGRIELDELVGAVFDELEIRAHSAGVQLAREVSAKTLFADPDLVRRVLENLVENAIRHAPEGSAVQVMARAAQDGIELRVQDTGPGVPLHQRELVFERFVSAGGEADGKASGISMRANRGLGLAFCKLVVEAHGGRIWVEDASPGAAFCVWMAHAD